MQLPLTKVKIKRNIFEKKNSSALTICHSVTTASLNAHFFFEHGKYISHASHNISSFIFGRRIYASRYRILLENIRL